MVRFFNIEHYVVQLSKWYDSHHIEHVAATVYKDGKAVFTSRDAKVKNSKRGAQKVIDLFTTAREVIEGLK